MWNKIKIVCILFFCISSIYDLYAQEMETVNSQSYQLQWQEVQGASGYLLEIRNPEGSMVLSEKIAVNFFKVENYSPGKYQHRVGVINKLGKIGSFSEWVPFEVVVSRVPKLTKQNVYAVSIEEKTTTFELIGDDFIDPMRVYIVLDGKKIPAKRVDVFSSGKARAIFDIDPSIDTGVYDLILENPREKTLNVKQRVVLSESKEKAQRFATRQEKILKKEIPEDYYDTPYFSTLWRSSLLPGWGQSYIDGQNWKLYLYPIVALGAAGGYASSLNKFSAARSGYEDAVLLGLFLSENSEAQLLWFLNRNTAEANFNQAKQQLSAIQAGVGLLSVFLLYNLVDSYFSARRNVAGDHNLPGFPLAQENIRIEAKMDRIPNANTTQNFSSGRLDSVYQLEFSYHY
jgi:hypothetical protein